MRDHVAGLRGGELTGFLTDGVTECWIDFSFEGHEFSVNDNFGDYWFFVRDAQCPDNVLNAVAEHFEILLLPKEERGASG